jgi:hypothetical protein
MALAGRKPVVGEHAWDLSVLFSWVAAWIGGGGDRRTLGIALGISLVISLINPYGPNAWAYFLGMIRNEAVREFSSEWKPPVNQGWQAGLFFGWCLLFCRW